MKNITLIKYLLATVDNGYIDKFVVKQINNYNIAIVIDIKNKNNITTVYNMIEANIHINRELLGKEVFRLKDGMIIKTYNDIIYNIRVRSKRSNKENKENRKSSKIGL